MSTIKSRLAALEARYAADTAAPVILFDDADPATVERVKASGRMLILLSECHGYEVWADGERQYGDIEGVRNAQTYTTRSEGI